MIDKKAKTNIVLTLTPSELNNLRGALEMEVEIGDAMMAEKRALLKRIIQLEKAHERAENFVKRGTKKAASATVVPLPEKPAS